MTEPETETEEEIVTTDLTDTEVTQDTTIETDDDTKYESTDLKKNGKKKKRSWKERCMDKKWTCEGESLWRIYMKSYTDSLLKLEKEDERTIPSDVRRLPQTAEVTEGTFPLHECFPLGGFQLEHRANTTNGLNRYKKLSIWRNMRTRQSTNIFRKRERIMRTGSGKWPSVWPCITRDLESELKTREKKGKKKRRDIFPCDPQVENEFLLREQRYDFANRKELGHVRAPVMCPKSNLNLVDRAVGERPGLVDGDYVIVELTPEERDGRVYANVVLRGLKGMHLPELSLLRERRNTWKFCFYQAIVALLAKTQLRYKYAWSANIDYIYDHAWTLYTHVGAINVKEKQRLDDVVVYNYKYSIEIELLREMKDVPLIRDVDFNYEESDLRTQITLRRKDPLKVKVELGCQKVTDPGYVSVHDDVRKIEEWFDEVPERYNNCIFRTARFSLAYWRDGLFWYLYNPYRCDEFGFWDDEGHACIVKFCSKDSLRRHLMILLLRAYAYEVPRSQNPNESPTDKNDVFDVQIFYVIFHCCQLHNLKLLQRGAPKPRYVDEYPSDSLGIEDQDAIDQEDEIDPKEPREKPTWLKCLRVTWSRCAATKRKERSSVKVAISKARWHQYYVEQSNRLFSLWGEIHITDGMFDETNRGMQTYACYVVCAGMTRIIAPEYWSSKILDVIVMCGDRYYTHSKLEAEFKSAKSEYAHVISWSKYLSDCFKIGEILFEARMLPAVCGRLYARSSECLWQSLEYVFHDYHFAILTCETVCLGLFKFCGAYYMCNVNSFGPPLFQYGQGAAYLMRATSFCKFVRVLVLTIGSPECSRFSLNPVEILRVVEVGPAFGTRTRMSERRNRFGRFAGKMCAFSEQKRKKMKK